MQLVGGAGAILINFVLCWAVVARVIRARVDFTGSGDDDDETFTLFVCDTHDGGAVVVVVVVGMRSNSVIASWMAFSS